MKYIAKPGYRTDYVNCRAWFCKFDDIWDVTNDEDMIYRLLM